MKLSELLNEESGYDWKALDKAFRQVAKEDDGDIVFVFAFLEVHGREGEWDCYAAPYDYPFSATFSAVGDTLVVELFAEHYGNGIDLNTLIDGDESNAEIAALKQKLARKKRPFKDEFSVSTKGKSMLEIAKEIHERVKEFADKLPKEPNEAD